VRNLDFDEIYAAIIMVRAGATSILPTDITDLRLNETYCGIMRDGVTGIPTAQLQAQVQELIDQLSDEIASIEQGSAVMLKAIYEGSAAGVVKAADKLAVSRKIGGADFDGSTNITLADIGVPGANLLDNSDFLNPVDQRNLDKPYTAGYMIDRWRWVPGEGGGTHCSRDATGIIITGPGSLTQVLEYAVGTNVVASVGVVSGTAWASYNNTTKTFTITTTNGATLAWAKLEKGSVATPYASKGYGAEWTACRRFFRRISGNGAMIGGSLGNGGQQFYILVNVEGMRVPGPTLLVSDKSTFTVYYITPSGEAGNAAVGTQLTTYAYVNINAMIPVSVAPYTTVRENYYILRAGATGYLDISADL